MLFPRGPELTYTQFLKQVDRGKVVSVSIDPEGNAEGLLDGGVTFTTAIPVELASGRLLERLEAEGVTIEAVPARVSLLSVLISLAPFLLLGWFWVQMGKRAGQQFGGLLGVGRSRAKIFDTERPTTTFADIAGYEGVKREISEVVEFLKDPDRYRRAGARAPRGTLMVGPPGTGKTLFARAVAGEASVPFISVTGSSFVEMFVGVGAARVRDLFAEARKRAPAIVFVDEIDAIGQRRSGGGIAVSNEEREQTLNQLLAEMDGFDPLEGIVVLAATNRPEILDPALMRPGRFDRQVVIGLPNQHERKAILEVHCKGKKLDPGVDLDVVARGPRDSAVPTSPTWSTRRRSSRHETPGRSSSRRTSIRRETGSSWDGGRTRTSSCRTNSERSPCTSRAMPSSRRSASMPIRSRR
jgi:cell division protease FtsH